MFLLGFRRKMTTLALCKSIESAIQWFQIHHRITFATIQNPAVYLSGARVSIFSTLVPRLWGRWGWLFYLNWVVAFCGLCLFLIVPWVVLQSLILAFTGHTHLLSFRYTSSFGQSCYHNKRCTRKKTTWFWQASNAILRAFKINSLFENNLNLKNARVCYAGPGVFALKYTNDIKLSIFWLCC